MQVINSKKVIGILSILTILPSIFIMIGLFAFFNFPFSHWIILKLFIIILFGLFGGITLLRGKKYGFYFVLLSLFLVFQNNISRLNVFLDHWANNKPRDFIVLSEIAYELFLGAIILLYFLFSIKREREKRV